ncbi:MAG: hypothetical protein ACUVTL_04620 [Thermoproteota archaeon]
MSRSRRGQLRVIEATIAAIMIFFSFLTASYFTRSPRSWTLSRGEDLTRMGYNVLHSLAVTDVLDNTIASGKQGWEQQLNFILEALLPSTVLYNLTVYKVLSKSDGWQTEYKTFNTIKITNTESDEAFIKSPEVVSISYLFTSRQGDAYSLVLQISEMRGETG